MKAGGRNKKTKRTAPKSGDVYLKLLVKVRTFRIVLERGGGGNDTQLSHLI